MCRSGSSGFDVAAAPLSLRQREIPGLERLVRDHAQQVADDVQPAALLVVGVRDVPRRPCGVGRGEHRVPRPRVVVPAAVRLQVHVRQLPDLPRVVDPALQAAGLLVGADLEPVLDQQDPGVDHRLLEGRHQLEEPLGLLRRAEAHHPLDARAVVPAAVEDHDLACGREVRDVALHVHLGLLALGRGGQGDHPEHPRADPLGDPLDRAPLPAVSRPSNTMQIFAPDALTHSCIATSSPCSMRISRSYGLRFIFAVARHLRVAVGLCVVGCLVSSSCPWPCRVLLPACVSARARFGQLARPRVSASGRGAPGARSSLPELPQTSSTTAASSASPHCAAVSCVVPSEPPHEVRLRDQERAGDLGQRDPGSSACCRSVSSVKTVPVSLRHSNAATIEHQAEAR